MSDKNDFILVAPAGYLFSDKTGTDAGIPYELLRRLSVLLNKRIYAIVNRLEVSGKLPNNLKIVEVGEDRGGTTLEQIMFLLKAYRQAKKILKYKPRLVHHMSTFIYKGSFNILAILGDLNNIPFIIGPAEYHPPVPKILPLEDTYYHKWGRLWTDMVSPKEASLRKVSFKLLNKLNYIRMNWFIKTLEKCDALIVVNQITKERFRTFLSEKKIRVIPLGVDVEQFTLSPLPKDHRILFIGKLSKRKGVEYLVRAMPKIVKQFTDSELHIVGDGPQKFSLMKLSKDLGVDSNIIFHGYVPRYEVPIYYRMCRVVCTPSIIEAFGLVALEAMASGRPIVCTNTTGYRETVINGKTGFIVPIANSDALAEAITTLLSDYELCYKMGALGRKIAEEKYDWRVIAKQYYDVYRKVSI